MKKALVKIKEKTELEQSAENYAFATVTQSLDRAKDIMRDKERAVNSFFALVKKEPDEIKTADVREWYQEMVSRRLSESYIYASLSHLSKYFEWLRSMPEFSHFIKINPVRTVMPKAPKKYNSSRAKSLTDMEISRLWLFVETAAKDDQNLIAVRDYAILRMFMATGMRREEIISVGAGDIRIEDDAVLIHSRIKGGVYEWRTIADREVKDALERYLRLAKRKSAIGQKDRALWIRFDRAAKAEYQKKKEKNPDEPEPRLSSHAFNKQIKRYAELAGVGDFHIHQFRHTFARIVSEESGSLNETPEILCTLQINQVNCLRLEMI